MRWLVDLGVLAGADDLDRLGGTVADAGAVTFVPSLAGLGAPWWEPEAKGVLTGLGLDTTGGHLVRAFCEGIAAQVADLAAAMAADLGAPLTSLSVDGGLTRSTLLMQTQADLLQLPVEVYASPDATARGAAAFASLGLDPSLALGDAVEPSTPGRDVRAPDRRGRGRGTTAPAPRGGRWRRRVAIGRGRMTVDESRTYDVVVVGGGVVGCAVARELARWPWRVALLEAADDVGDGTSKANTAILHTGFDATPGTLESRLVARGFDLLSAYAARSGIPVEPVGALLVAWDPEQLAALPGLAEKAAKNGYQRTRLVEVDELYAAEPHLGAGALGALEVPDESVICPWTTTLAFAVEAVGLGRELHLGTRLLGVERAATGDTCS